MTDRPRIAIVLLVVGATVVTLWRLLESPSAAGKPAAEAAMLTPRLATVASTASAAPSAPAVTDDQYVAFERWMHTVSSLRGSELDGDWGRLDSKRRLIPSRSVRLRFDQLLTLQGETSLEKISAYVEWSARRTHGDAAQQLIALWRHYLALIHVTNSTGLDLSDPHNWSIALAERHEARRLALGSAWATAFFEQDEAEFAAWSRQAVLPLSERPVAVDIEPGTLTPAGRDRLKQEQLAWAAWQSRLTQARAEWSALQAQTALSNEARTAAFDTWIGAHFDASEQRRVRALLRDPSSPP